MQPESQDSHLKSHLSKAPSKYIIKTLGCKANSYDSLQIETALQKQGWESGDSSEVELCIVNSCTVTDEADKQSRKLAEKLAKEHPQAKIVLTGCGAEVNPEQYLKTPGIHYVIGNQNKDQFGELLQKEFSLTSHILNQDISPKILGKVLVYKEMASQHPLDREWPATEDSFQTPESIEQGNTDKTRVFLKIQEGCDSFCTYCIIPYGRGPNRSLKPQQILQQIHALVARGVQEIVLTGTNIGEYGTDWDTEPQLDALLEMIFSETSLPRLRVSSLDPTEITSRMLALMEKEPRFCPHFHVSLQSPVSKILKLMKRKYRSEEVIQCLEKISQLQVSTPGGVYVGMDLITGFPGETQEDFDQGYEMLKNLPWTRLHVFPYSERKGTPATKLPHSVPQSLRTERSRKLNQLSMQRLETHYREVLKNVAVHPEPLLHHILIEKTDPKGWTAGFTRNYLKILVPPHSLLAKDTLVRNSIISLQPSDIMIDSRGQDVGFIV